MILVDTSVWIRHLRDDDPGLTLLLDQGQVLGHPWVVGELALGNLRDRDQLIGLLQALPHATVAASDEVLGLISRERLHGIGIGYVDAQLIAAALLTPDSRVWSLDNRLAAAAKRLGVALEPAVPGGEV